MMDFNHLEHDLFLLMVNLSQLNNQERIVNLFLEAMNSLEIGISLRFHTEQVEDIAESLEVATLTHSFGKIDICGDLSKLPGDALALVHNAVRMLALILENRWQAQLLANENLRLEDAVQERTLQLSKINQQLEWEIQERLQAEMAVRESEARLQILIRNMPILMDAFDEDHRIVAWNRECECVTGYSAGEIIGNPRALELLYPDPAYRKKVENEIFCLGADGKLSSEYRSMERSITCKDGQIRTVAWSNISKKFPIAGWKFWAVGVDITDRLHAVENLRRSLQEKEVLLKEIHHRVKNNLQVMISLLGIQSGFIRDPQVLDMFRDSQNRVYSMALVHEELYQSDNLAEVDFNAYVQRLTRSLASIYGNRPVRLIIDMARSQLGIDQAIPCGLIINELVSNAFKYAFQPGQDGEILVRMENDPASHFHLTVADNGPGLPPQINVRSPETLGLQLVNILVEQLDGQIEVSNEHGAVFHVTFNRLEPAEEGSDRGSLMETA